MYKVVALLCLVSVCFAAQNIIFPTNQAATLVPGVNGGNPTLVLAPLNINDPNQQWNLNGVISSAAPGYTNYVFDVQGGGSTEGTPVILYAPNGGKNQQWSVDANGGVKSGLSTTSPIYLAPTGTGGLKISYAAPPAVPTFPTPSNKPWVCLSVGDPHISPYSTGRNDLYSPGSQQPGTYTLSKTGSISDPYYTLIQADQQLCRANVPGVYCNQRAIIRTQGHVVQVQGNTVTIDGIVVPVTGTYNVGDGVTVTKTANNDYTVTYPQGTLRVNQVTSYIFPYTDITVTTKSGPQPTGGACTKYIGDNVPTIRVLRDVTPYSFLLSWRAPNRSADLFQYSSDLAWRAANPLVFNTTNGHFTTNNATLLAAAQKACAPLLNTSALAIQCSSFGVLNSQDFYQACLDDVIVMGDVSFAASVTDSYTTVCSAFSNGTVPLPTSGKSSTAVGPGLAASVPQSSSQYFVITARDVNGNIVTAGGDAFVINSVGPGAITFSTTYLGGGLYNVSFTPNTPGFYNISVSLNSAQVKNSPFAVQVVSQATDPTQTTAAGLGLGNDLESATTYSFTITARTSDGTQRTKGGDAVKVVISGFAFVDPIIDKGDGTYIVSYEQDAVGPFTITVTINGGAIKGSPFNAATTSK